MSDLHPDLRLVDVAAERRFEIRSDADPEALAFVDYGLRDDAILLMHTEVRPDLEGRGIGTRTAEMVVDHVRRSGLKALVGCPFLTSWLRRHPQEHDILLRPLKPQTAQPDASGGGQAGSA